MNERGKESLAWEWRRVNIQLHCHDGTVWQGHGVWDENYPDWRPEIIDFYNFLVLQDGNWLREKSAKIERLSALGEPILNIKN
jgi:hypothetical protein